MSIRYFVDSENVGDNWIALLSHIEQSDEVLVFYTAKSPHMNYESVILLRESDKNVSFIKCHEGNNALDFQLSTYLGFLVHDMKADDTFIIVSNDTGFDAVVKYWSQSDISIKRISGKDCHEDVSEVSKSLTSDEELIIEETEIIVPEEPVVSIEAPDLADRSYMDRQANEILYLLGRNDLQRLHTSLTAVFGDTKGKQYYNSFKSNHAYDHFIAKHQPLDTKQKQHSYCSIVFAIAGNGVSMPSDFPDFIVSCWNKKKNLNSLRASLQGKYGKDVYETYYKLIKAHVKILYKI